MELLRLMKTRLNVTWGKVCIGKNLFDAFLVQNGLEQGVAVSPSFHFTLGCYQEGPGKPGRSGT
jgi:hypothetical protein